MHAITVSVADKMRPHIYGGGITDPRKAWLTLREVNEHATASKRQCLETEQHGLKRGSYCIKVKNLCDQLEAFGMKNYDADNLSQSMKSIN